MHHEPPIDRILGTGDIGRIVGQEEQDDSGCLVRRPDSAKRHLGDHEFLEALLGFGGKEVPKAGVDRARNEHVDADAAGRERRGPRFVAAYRLVTAAPS
jgi:hypothetical protein